MCPRARADARTRVHQSPQAQPLQPGPAGFPAAKVSALWWPHRRRRTLVVSPFLMSVVTLQTFHMLVIMLALKLKWQTMSLGSLIRADWRSR